MPQVPEAPITVVIGRHPKRSIPITGTITAPTVKMAETVLQLPTQPTSTAITSIDTTPPAPTRDLDPPASVKAIYDTDLDITAIHAAVIARFGALRGQVPDKKAEILRLEKSLEATTLTVNDRKQRTETIAALQAEIKALEAGTGWQTYIGAARPLLEAYAPLSSNETKGIVRIGSKMPKEDGKRVKARIEIIQSYLAVAGKYITIDQTWYASPPANCPSCGAGMIEAVIDEELGAKTCPCGYEQPTLNHHPSFKDASRVNVGARNAYEDRQTFERAFDRLEGRYAGDKMPELLESQLDNYFASKRFPVGAAVRQRTLQANGHRQGTTIALLIEGLQSTNNAEYYKMVYLIAQEYWGWKLMDLSAYRQGVIDDYELTQPIYNQIKTRTSSLNVNIRLYAHLKARGAPVEWEDFKILGGRDTLDYHQSMLKQMRDISGVHFPDLI